MLRLDENRLLGALDELAQIGAIDGGGCARLALSDDDKAGRDLVVGWMKALGLEVRIDAIGNVVGLRAGRENLAPVMTGSHIDTVRTGGRYDGNYGVLAGLEVVRALNEARITTRRPIAVAFFTNEEGARFQPDMLGSLVYAGGLGLNEAYAPSTRKAPRSAMSCAASAILARRDPARSGRTPSSSCISSRARSSTRRRSGSASWKACRASRGPSIR